MQTCVADGRTTGGYVRPAELWRHPGAWRESRGDGCRIWQSAQPVSQRQRPIRCRVPWRPVVYGRLWRSTAGSCDWRSNVPSLAAVSATKVDPIQAVLALQNVRDGASEAALTENGRSAWSLDRRGRSVDNSVRLRSLRGSIVWRLSSCVVLVSSRCRLPRCARLGLIPQRP
jgi:hypothetical protein